MGRPKAKEIKSRAEKERERRRKIKEDPIKRAHNKEKERLRYLDKKNRKVVKPICELSVRSQRQQRKKWKESSKRYRTKIVALKRNSDAQEKYLAQNTPPESDSEDNVPNQNPDIPNQKDILHKMKLNQRRCV